MEHIKKITDSIKCTEEQKKIILSKAEEILNVHISKAENNEFNILKNTNLKKIAGVIIYTIGISTKNMVKISAGQIANFANLKSYMSITNYYNTHFKQLYPRKEFLFNVYTCSFSHHYIFFMEYLSGNSY